MSWYQRSTKSYLAHVEKIWKGHSHQSSFGCNIFFICKQSRPGQLIGLHPLYPSSLSRRGLSEGTVPQKDWLANIADSSDTFFQHWNLTCSTVTNIATFHEPSRAKLGKNLQYTHYLRQAWDHTSVHTKKKLKKSQTAIFTHYKMPSLLLFWRSWQNSPQPQCTVLLRHLHIPWRSIKIDIVQQDVEQPIMQSTLWEMTTRGLWLTQAASHGIHNLHWPFHRKRNYTHEAALDDIHRAAKTDSKKSSPKTRN